MFRRISVEATMLTRDSIVRLARELNTETGLEHARHTIPLHFTMGAYQRYRYNTRKRGYTTRKRRQFGHTNPNEFSGALKAIILATAPAGVRATSKGVRIKAKGTRQHPMWKYTKEELEQVSDSELDQYGSKWARGFASRAKRPEYKKKTRISKGR
jgi:hypothetical protein